MNNITRVRFRRELHNEWHKVDTQRKLAVAMYSFLAGMLLLAILFLTGCTTAQQPMTKAAFQAAVTLGEQFALEKHPEAVPHVRAAASVVCATANGTNVSPEAIVSALEASNITNAQAKIVLNGSLAIYNVIWPYVSSNAPVAMDYAKALCDAMNAGLPPGNPMAKKAVFDKLPPRLR